MQASWSNMTTFTEDDVTVHVYVTSEYRDNRVYQPWTGALRQTARRSSSVLLLCRW